MEPKKLPLQTKVSRAVAQAWPFQKAITRRRRILRFKIIDGIGFPIIASSLRIYRECPSCFDQQSPDSSAITPSQPYCAECVQNLFMYAARDESLYPPRYGGWLGTPISLEAAKPYLSEEVLKKFEEKAKEWGTPFSDRLYCSEPSCSAFLGGLSPPDSKAAPTPCSSETCKRVTCVGCRDEWHARGEDECSGMNDSNIVTGLKAAYHYQRCPNCKHLVERTEGCDSMYCRCQVQFCYACGGRDPGYCACTVGEAA